jgi:small-conductance mechanosensitive channel
MRQPLSTKRAMPADANAARRGERRARELRHGDPFAVKMRIMRFVILPLTLANTVQLPTESWYLPRGLLSSTPEDAIVSVFFRVLCSVQSNLPRLISETTGPPGGQGRIAIARIPRRACNQLVKQARRLVHPKGHENRRRSVAHLALTLCLLLLSPRSLQAEAPVTLNDEELFVLHDTIGKQGPADRARTATQVLDGLKSQTTTPIRLVPTARGITVYGAKRPIVELTQADSEGAGRAELRAFADEVKISVVEGLARERTRSRVAQKVLAVSSVVFLGLLSLLLLRGVGNAARRARRRLYDEKRDLGALRIDQVELLPQGAVREGLGALLFSASWAARAVILYSYVLVCLSLFENTRELARSATGHLLAPVADILKRLASNLPLTLSVVLVLAVVGVLIRFVQTYARAIEGGSTQSEWFSPDTARVTGHLLSAALFFTCLLFIAPLLTGRTDGVLPRIGVLGLGALSLACSPLLACAAIGTRQVYANLLRRGDDVEYGGRRGVVERVELLDLALRTTEGAKVRVPHLLSLFHPTVVFPKAAYPKEESAPS